MKSKKNDKKIKSSNKNHKRKNTSQSKTTVPTKPKRTHKHKSKSTRKQIGGNISIVQHAVYPSSTPTTKPVTLNNFFNKILSTDQSFNKDPYVRESHNCYMYFLNKKNKDVVDLCKKDFETNKLCIRAQPGYYAGYKQLNINDYNCDTMVQRTLADNPNIKKISEEDECGSEYYKGAIVVAPKRDYHFYRLNDDGVWSHKPGWKPATTKDSDNVQIKNNNTPVNAKRNYGGTLNYKNFCSYFCVPRENKLKNMSHIPSDNNNVGTRKKQ